MDPTASAEMAKANDRWRTWVTAHTVGGAAVSGLIAVQFMTLFGHYFVGFGLPNLLWPHFNGAALSVQGEKWGSAGSFFAGQSLHMTDGVVFAILFVMVLRWLPPLSMLKTNMTKALGFSTILALISMGFLVPYVYVPHSGYGFFSFYHSPEHWKLPLSILLNHWEYGTVLGLLYNPKSS